MFHGRSIMVSIALLSLCAACGAKSSLIVGPPLPDASVGTDGSSDRAPDRSADAFDVPFDIPFDLVRSDVPANVMVVCPAPVHSQQTMMATLVAQARSNVGLPLRYQWTVERNALGSMLTPLPPDQPMTLVRFDVGGEWTLRFTATDSRGNADTCTVNLYAEPAILLICPQDQSHYQGATVALQANATSRVGRTLSYAWSFVSRPPTSTSPLVPTNQPSTTFVADQLGDWQVRMVVTDSGGLTAQCVTNVHVDADVIVACPADLVSRPFASVSFAATASSRQGLPLTYRWEIVDRPVTSTASLTSTNTPTTGFTFDVAGNWTYRFTATNSQGNFAFCTTRALAATDEAVRVELVWNIDRSCRSCNPQGGGIDIDLHLANVSLAMGRWDGLSPTDSDCYYANCKCGSPGTLCTMENIDWPPVGSRVNNPQQDVDHISDLPGPENINIVLAETGSQFDVGVHYFSGREPTPCVARVYCTGTLVYESEAVVLSSSGGASTNPLWRVGRITVTPAGCTFERCGMPGNVGACIRPIDQW